MLAPAGITRPAWYFLPDAERWMHTADCSTLVPQDSHWSCSECAHSLHRDSHNKTRCWVCGHRARRNELLLRTSYCHGVLHDLDLWGCICLVSWAVSSWQNYLFTGRLSSVTEKEHNRCPKLTDTWRPEFWRVAFILLKTNGFIIVNFFPSLKICFLLQIKDIRFSSCIVFFLKYFIYFEARSLYVGQAGLINSEIHLLLPFQCWD